MTTETRTDSVDADTRGASGLGDRVKHSIVLAQKRWVGLPDQVRSALDELLARVRDRLDIPSKSEISTLLDRIENIDRKLASLETHRASKLPVNGAKAQTARVATAEPTAAPLEQAGADPAAEPLTQPEAAPKTKAKAKAAAADEAPTDGAAGKQASASKTAAARPRKSGGKKRQEPS